MEPKLWVVVVETELRGYRRHRRAGLTVYVGNDILGENGIGKLERLSLQERFGVRLSDKGSEANVAKRSTIPNCKT